MTITGQSSLDRDEIQRMVRDAEAHADEDRRRKEEVDIRNSADTLVYQTEKLIKDQGSRMVGEEKDKMEAALKELKAALGGADLDAVRRTTEDLSMASQAFAMRLYQQASDNPQGGGGEGGDGRFGAGFGGGAGDDEVVDAEIVEEGP